MSLNLLEEELVDLAERLSDHDIDLIVGGGMGLYLWETRVERRRAPNYPENGISRSTGDLDLILSGKVIIRRKEVETLRDAIGAMGYEVNPDAKYFQFQKEVEGRGEVKIDLLAAPPVDEDNVKVRSSRVRPHQTSEIHGRLTPEAAHVDFRPVSVQLDKATVFLPSAFNFVNLKLHAFRDRHDDSDKELGRHHALDIFRIIAAMGREDWETAEAHRDQHRDADYLEESRRIRATFFESRTSLGMVRLQEHPDFKANRNELLDSLETFITDLEELLEG